MHESKITPPAPARKLPWGGLAFVALLALIGLVYLAWSHFRPAPAEAPGKDLAAAARAYLSERGVRPLSEPLRHLLDDAARQAVPTQPHTLLGRQAPEFELEDPQEGKHTLGGYLQKGPVVLVFYYGYYCNHCVGQLFALDKDLAYFHELGAEVVALSPDPPANTRRRFRQYGAFHFPVLSDPKNAVAEKYGVYRPAEAGREENLDHATFVLDRDGVVRWAQLGDEPFTNDRALLVELARLAGRVPAAKK